MVKSKIILTLSIIALLIGISIIPVTANVSQISKPDELLKYVFFEEDGGVTQDAITLTSERTSQLKDEIAVLMDNLELVDNRIDVLQIFWNLFRDQDDDSILQELLEGAGGITLNPLGKRVFVVSFGRNNIFNPLRSFQINLFRPATLFWYYSGTSERFLSDKTIILDPYPLNVKVLDGRQIGMMRRFVGIYVYKPGSQSGESFTFFIGYTARVLGVDLSPAG